MKRRLASLAAAKLWSEESAPEISAPPPPTDTAQDEGAGLADPEARVIVVASDGARMGKSLIAFEIAIALANAGHRVSALDLDVEHQSLHGALEARAATAERLGATLPMPRVSVFTQDTGAALRETLAGLSWQNDYLVLDLAEVTSPVARRAIAMAHTLVTPVRASFEALEGLGSFHPATQDVIAPSFFSRMVGVLRAEREERAMPAMDWIVTPNRLRSGQSAGRLQFETALAGLAPSAGFRIGAGLGERVAYGELFLLGLSHLDMPHIPALAHLGSPVEAEILRFVEDLRLASPAARARLLA